MDIKSIFFPVEKIPTVDLLPGYEYPSDSNHAVVITKPDGTKKVVNFCSEDYQLVKNSEVVPAFLDEVSKFWDIDTQIRQNGWSQFFIDIIIKNDAHKVVQVGEVFPKIRMVNSYDGRIRYHFNMGFWRKVCSNGLSIPLSENIVIRKLHTPGITKVTEFSAVLQMTTEFISKADGFVELYRELTDQVLRNPQDRVKEVIEETKFPSSLEESVMERLQFESRLINTPINDWMVYNAFNYQLNHSEEVKTKEMKRVEVDEEIINYLLNY